MKPTPVKPVVAAPVPVKPVPVKFYWKEVDSTRLWISIVLMVVSALVVFELIFIQQIEEWVGWAVFGALHILALLVIFLRWTFVDESTSKAIMRMGSFNRMVFTKSNYRLNRTTWEAIVAPRYKNWILGGLRFYVWPFESVYRYTWEWIKSMPDGTIVPKPEETVDFILTQNIYAYGLQVKGHGLVTDDKVPIEISMTLTAKIVNPYKALFDVKNWFDTFIGRVQPAVRDYVNNVTYDALIRDDQLDTTIFRKMVTDGIIPDLNASYGIDLVKVEFREIKVTDDYQKTITAQLEGEMEARKRTASTMGAFWEMLAHDILGEPAGTTKAEKSAYAAKVAQLRADYYDDPKDFETTYAAAIARSNQWINRQIDAATPGALKSFYFKGGRGSGMGAIALLGEALRGGGGGPTRGDSPSGSVGSETKKKKKETEPPVIAYDEDEEEDDEDDEK